MYHVRWYYHPLFIFIISLAALATSLFLYLHWYLNVSHAFVLYLSRYHQGPEQFLETKNWVIVLVMSVLMGLIFVGMVMLYLFYQKMKELYRMQQNFINGFTHELKTPLASLKIFLETFGKYNLSQEEQKKYLEYMLQDIRRINDNVDRILKMGKMEEKKYHAEKKVCDVADLIKKFFAENLQYTSNIILKLNVPKNKFYIYFDPELFGVVLANLVNNALSYKSDKKLILEIDGYDQYNYLRLEFKDNGIGVSKNDRTKIFKKFYQVYKTTKGTGIGLFLVTQILKIHKATIEVKSLGPGFGSTFILKMPLSKVLAQSIEQGQVSS